jgi:hypothetical protein
MLDVLATAYLAAYSALQCAVLVGLAPLSKLAKLVGLAASAAWLGLVVAVYAAGGIAAWSLGPVPVNFLPFALALALLSAAWLLSARLRAALRTLPLNALIALHAGRLGGVLFLLLHAQGRLAAPFGPVAGWGDIITGGTALLLVAWLALGRPVRRSWLAAWNVFGSLDLALAIGLAALSAPGAPFRMFFDEPGSAILATLPWILVPAVLVPVDLFVHALIAAKLAGVARGAAAVPALAGQAARGARC